MGIKVQRVPVINVHHLDFDTSYDLDKGSPDWCPYLRGENGFLLDLGELSSLSTPHCLKNIREWLLANNFTDLWIRLDRDAQEAIKLPVYQW